MDYLVLLLNIMYIAIAALQYFVAPKVGPNPYFGFRTGYTMSSDDAWKKSNRLMGKMMLIHSFLLLPMFLLPDSLPYFLVLWIVPMIIFIPLGIKYASNVLEIEGARKEASTQPMEPITAGILWSISPAILYLLLILLVFYTYPHLSPIIAVHFDSAGNPNGWATKSDFVVQYSLFALIFPFIAYLFLYLGKKYPLFIHPGKTRFNRDVYLKTTLLSMDAGLAVIILVYYSIYIYDISKTSFSASYFLLMTLIIVMIPIVYLVAKWRR